MYNKISALTLALLITGSGLAIELTPGENIAPQEAAQVAQVTLNKESKSEENSEKLESITEEPNSIDILAVAGMAGISFASSITKNNTILHALIATGFTCFAVYKSSCGTTDTAIAQQNIKDSATQQNSSIKN